MDHLERIYPRSVVDTFRREHPEVDEDGAHDAEHVRELWSGFSASKAGLRALDVPRQVNPLHLTLKYAGEGGEGRVYGSARVDPHEPGWAARLERHIGAEMGHPVHLREDTPECTPLGHLSAFAIGELVHADKPALVVAGTTEEVRTSSVEAKVPISNVTVPLARVAGGDATAAGGASLGTPPSMDPWHKAGEERNASLARWWASAAERRDRGEAIGADAGFLLAHADDRVAGRTGVTPENIERWAAEQGVAGTKLTSNAEAAQAVHAAVRSGCSLPVAHAYVIGAPVVGGGGVGVGGATSSNPCANARFIPFDATNPACIGAKFIPDVAPGGDGASDAAAHAANFVPLIGDASAAGANSHTSSSVPHISDSVAVDAVKKGVSMHMSQLPEHIVQAKARTGGGVTSSTHSQVWVIPASNVEAGMGRSLAPADRVGVRTNPLGEAHVELELLSGRRAILGTPPAGLAIGREITHGQLGSGTIVCRKAASYFDTTHNVYVALSQ